MDSCCPSFPSSSGAILSTSQIRTTVSVFWFSLLHFLTYWVNMLEYQLLFCKKKIIWDLARWFGE